MKGQSDLVAAMLVDLFLALAVVLLLLSAACATATTRARLQTQDVVIDLIQFHGAVAEQFDLGGMELEHYHVVNRWIASELRVLQANPTHWEAQARLDWPRVRSIVTPFESLQPWAAKIDGLLQ